MFLFEDYNSNGEQLSDKQAAFFIDSVMRDSSGNLQLFHHGDARNNIEVFNCANHPKFFSLSKDYADGYGEKTYSVYLNITNPFSLKDDDEFMFIAKNFYNWLRQNGLPRVKFDTKVGYGVPMQLVDPHDGKYYFYDFLKTTDYDGIIVNEGYSKPKMMNNFDSNLSYVPLYANQIKAISNLDPTESNNIYK